MSHKKPRTGRRDDEHGLTSPQHTLTARQTAAPAAGLTGLQASAGNAAVVQMLRQAGHLGDERRPSVQRAQEENPQDHLTQEYWEGKAGVGGKDKESAGKRAAMRTGSGQKGKKGKGGSGGRGASGDRRTMDQIVTETGPALLRELETKDPSAGQLQLYRSMSWGEAESILSYWGDADARAALTEYVRTGTGTSAELKKSHTGLTVGAHLGDQGQADRYYSEVQLRFVLKPGAHELLFTPEYMALGPGYKTDLIRTAQERDSTFKAASQNEGTLPGYIGVKAEHTEPYSIGIAQGNTSRKGGRELGPSQLLFQLFLDRVELVKNKTGKPLPGETESAAEPAA
ncbi:hypothetical protein [Streptomyces althioticus]|uniref:hypothetical protein n=1 Tax=Streptomyces althioticus TaxID=83380 RepID=UPI0033DE6357